MIHYKTNNNEHHVAIGVPDDAIVKGIEKYYAGLMLEFTINDVPDIVELENIGYAEIIGTYDKEKNLIDFNSRLVKIVDYIASLQSLTKDSEFNKFVILKVW